MFLIKNLDIEDAQMEFAVRPVRMLETHVVLYQDQSNAGPEFVLTECLGAQPTHTAGRSHHSFAQTWLAKMI